MIKELAQKYADEVISLREKLHRHPETAFMEYKTSEIIQAELEKLGIPYVVMAKTGVLATITGGRAGKTLLLRADIDGLPIAEETDLSFKSLNQGFMHACGHDVHTACLLGAAKILNESKENICGVIKLMFQPAEEGAGGAQPMIGVGILEDPPVDAAFALHVEPLEKVGVIQIRDGAIMACPDEFTIHIHGRGGHGSAPHQCVDPIAIAADLVRAYQGIVRKTIDPMLPCVVSVCSIQAGNCPNVIPDTAVLEGTVRALDYETREKIARRLAETAEMIAASAGGSCDFEYRKLYPPVINDIRMNDVVVQAAEKLGIAIKYLPYASMAGDDFSYIAEQVPASYFRLGAGLDMLSFPIHSSKFNVDNQAIPLGVSIFAQIALDFLG